MSSAPETPKDICVSLRETFLEIAGRDSHFPIIDRTEFSRWASRLERACQRMDEERAIRSSFSGKPPKRTTMPAPMGLMLTPRTIWRWACSRGSWESRPRLQTFWGRSPRRPPGGTGHPTVNLREAVSRILWGPHWRVMLNEPGVDVVYRTVRARSGFAARWKVASRLHAAGDPQVGYLAFKWLNGLQLDEGESVEAVPAPEDRPQ